MTEDRHVRGRGRGPGCLRRFACAFSGTDPVARGARQERSTEFAFLASTEEVYEPSFVYGALLHGPVGGILAESCPILR
jgi:hypothetical protein